MTDYSQKCSIMTVLSTLRLCRDGYIQTLTTLL